MVSTRQKTGHSKPKVWRNEDPKPLPVKIGTRAKPSLAKTRKVAKKSTTIHRSSSFSSTDAVIHDMSSEKIVNNTPQPAPVLASVIASPPDVEKEIKKLVPKIVNHIKFVRPHVLKQVTGKGVLIARQEYGMVKLDEIGHDIALTVTPILTVLSFSLSTGIPDLFPTRAMLRVKYACYNEAKATESLQLPDFKSMLDVVQSMFCGEYKTQMLEKLQQHMAKVESELERMKTWIMEPKDTLSFLEKNTGLKAPVDYAHQAPTITCTDCLHDLPRHWHANQSSFSFACPIPQFKKREWDDLTCCGKERNIFEFLWMDRRIAFINHPVLDEPIVMMRRNANVLNFLASGQKFDVESQQGRRMFLNVVKLFKDSQTYVYISDQEENVSSDDETVAW
jgi:hypothetical protein